jgi:hypothetical protein
MQSGDKTKQSGYKTKQGVFATLLRYTSGLLASPPAKRCKHAALLARLRRFCYARLALFFCEAKKQKHGGKKQEGDKKPSAIKAWRQASRRRATLAVGVCVFCFAFFA